MQILMPAFAFPAGGCEVFVRQYPAVRVRRAAGSGCEVEPLHVGGRQLTPVIGELLGVVIARLCNRFLARDDVVHEIQRQEIGLFVMAAGGHFTGGPLDHDAAVEGRQLRNLVDRHPR